MIRETETVIGSDVQARQYIDKVSYEARNWMLSRLQSYLENLRGVSEVEPNILLKWLDNYRKIEVKEHYLINNDLMYLVNGMTQEPKPVAYLIALENEESLKGLGPDVIDFLTRYNFNNKEKVANLEKIIQNIIKQGEESIKKIKITGYSEEKIAAIGKYFLRIIQQEELPIDKMKKDKKKYKSFNRKLTGDDYDKLGESIRALGKVMEYYCTTNTDFDVYRLVKELKSSITRTGHGVELSGESDKRIPMVNPDNVLD